MAKTPKKPAPAKVTKQAKKPAKRPARKLTERQADQQAAETLAQARFASTVAARVEEAEAVTAAPTAFVRAKPTLWARFRSAVTGLFVSKKYAQANPDTTVREKVD